MTIKILFFDTCALIKLFKTEDGTDTVKWIVSPSIKVANSFHFCINEQVCVEFKNKIIQFSNLGSISPERGEAILDKFERHYRDKVFRVIGQEIISNTKSEIGIDDIYDSLSVKIGKNDWDAIIFQSIVNALASFGGDSHPVLITADSNFSKKVSALGYRVFNPVKQTKNELLALFA